MNTFRLSRNSFYTACLFLVWPFGVAILAIRLMRKRDMRFIIPCFFGFLGYTVQPSPGSDINYAIILHEQYIDMSFYEFQTQFVKQITGEVAGGSEIYVNLLAFLVSIISDNWRIIFLIWGLFLGYICVKIWSELYNDLKNSAYSSKISYFLLFSFALFVPPIFAMNGRFWLAYWVFLFLVLKYLDNSRAILVALPLLCILIHQAFAVAYVLFFLFAVTYKIRNINKVYYTLALISFFYANEGISYIIEVGQLLGGQYENWMVGYASEEGIKQRAEFLSNDNVSLGHWFWQKKNSYVYNTLLITLSYLRFVRKVTFDKLTESLFQVFMVFFIFHNLVEAVPNLGERYNTILIGMLLLIFFKLTLTNGYKSYRVSFYALLIPLLIALLFVFRMEFESMHAYVFFENPITFMINGDETRLIEFFN